MSRLKPGRTLESMRKSILNAAALSFLEKGYTATKLKDLAKETELNIGSVINLFPHKDDILCGLVDYVVAGQFASAAEILGEDGEKDPVLLYVFDTALQLYIAESSEHIRDLYLSAYTLQSTSHRIYQLMLKRTPHCFGSFFPDYEEKDFYELEIASASVMRGYISVPCDMYFTIDRKVHRFLEAALRIYKLPEDKIKYYINYISRFDFTILAKQSIQDMLDKLQN